MDYRQFNRQYFKVAFLGICSQVFDGCLCIAKIRVWMNFFELQKLSDFCKYDISVTVARHSIPSTVYGIP